jgi:hypothetical protein
MFAAFHNGQDARILRVCQLMILLSANEAASLLDAGISNSATTILLRTGDGALFPNPGADEYFNLILNDAATGQLYEICWCTARAGDSLTVLRGQEGSTARSWVLGDFAFNNITAVSTSTARAYAAQRTPTLPYTMVPADQGVPQYCGTTGTITLPAVAGIQDGYLSVIVCTSGSATITVNTNSATVVLPSGNVTTTFTVGGLQQSITLQWNAGASVWYAIGAASVSHGQQSFTTSGSFTYPAGVFQVFVKVWAAGGAGNTTSDAINPGGGGGAGEYREGWISGAPGNVITITVGAGVSGAGGNGNASQFGSSIICVGGNGGTAGSSGGGGNGGSGGSGGSGGTLEVPGGSGGAPFPTGSSGVAGGYGGAAYASTGIVLASGPLSGFNGNAGQFPGGGSTGCSGTVLASGAGLVVVTW